MAHLRVRLWAHGIRSAAELANVKDGAWVNAAGSVIVRQRPGTAKGFLFIRRRRPDRNIECNSHSRSLSGQSHAALSCVASDDEGPLQKQQGVIQVRGRRFRELRRRGAIPPSYDFH